MQYLSDKYPFLMNYFKNAILNPEKNIAHCILFYGSDLQAQYDIALEIALMLNCSGDHSPDCQCLNCKWIRENKHPAVITVSKTDSKPSDDTSRTVISIEQARMIKNDLLISSDYHRVYIFCDKDKDGNVCGHNEQNFQTDAANSLLKTFEEPPNNTTFIFLTKDKSDLISTIVSRSQSFYVPSMRDEDRDFDLVTEIMENYLELEKSQVLDFNEKIYNLSQEYDSEYVFNMIQNYLSALLKENLENKPLKIKLISDLKSVEKAKKELQLNMNTQTIVENLCYDLILNN